MRYYSSGKVLLSGEYLVLDGAEALALPTVFGQFFDVLDSKNDFFLWQSFHTDKQLWFSAKLSLDLSEIIETTDKKSAQTLQKLLKFIQTNKPELFTNALHFTSQLTFDKDWGLGSSSTFIANLSKWSGIDAFELSNMSLGGSGYDIALALAEKPIIYHLRKQKPEWKTVDFNPNFTDKLWFVYLNKKQNSREGIADYHKQKATDAQIEKISNITKQLANCSNYERFCHLLDSHETLISEILKRPTVKQQFFADFNGSIKSLGAWGGDFVLATGNQVETYFKTKGYATIINFKNFIK